jgi:glycosyltransferase involved in cell wall biosynthesis
VRGSLPQTIGDVIETWRLTRRELSSFDLVLAHQATNATGIIAQRGDVPVVFVFHASVPLEQRLLRRRLAPTARLARLALHPSFVLLERVAVRSSERVLVLSEFSRSLLSTAHPETSDRAVLVSGGVDTARFSPLRDSERSALRAQLGVALRGPLLLSVRRLEPRMGLEELVQAAKLLADGGMEFTLAIAGDGIFANRLRSLAAELGLGDHVQLLGRVGEDVLPGLYAAADLFVLPTTAYEGFGISTVEAMASGCPVVGTDVGATPELLAPFEPRLIAARAAPTELAVTIRWALENLDGAARSRCAEYARERFDWERVIVGWEDALERTVSTTSR